MDKVRVIHDTLGHTLTVWLGDPATEADSSETGEEFVVMKNSTGRGIGFELLHYSSVSAGVGLNVETLIR